MKPDARDCSTLFFLIIWAISTIIVSHTNTHQILESLTIRTGRLRVALPSLDGNRDIQRLVDGFVVTATGGNERAGGGRRPKVLSKEDSVPGSQAPQTVSRQHGAS